MLLDGLDKKPKNKETFIESCCFFKDVPAKKENPVPKKPSKKKAAPKKKAKPAPIPTPKPVMEKKDNYTATGYRDSQAALMKEKRASDREIGDLPDSINIARREFALKSLDDFKTTYFPNKFYREDCPPLKKCTDKIESVIGVGGQVAIGLPRGTGKTSNLEAGTTYAICSGKRSFVVLIADESDSAGRLLENLKYVFETNVLLAEDFPEICYPIIKLEGITHRAKGQLHKGERTRITWSNKYIQFPKIDGSTASEAIVYPCSIDKVRRGLHFEKADGSVMRPDLVLIDDPQNDESARSRDQTNKREKTICGTIAGLAGQDQQIAMLLACTVIYEDDLAYKMLSRDIHPEWQGEKHALITEWADADAMKLWENYRALFLDEISTHAERGVDAMRHPESNKYYQKNKKDMDSGCIVMDNNLWNERYEISAVQHAMNLFFESPETFMSEYQNEPKKKNDSLHSLNLRIIMSRKNGIKQGDFPENVVYKCAAIDLNYYALSWGVAGFRNDFTANIADYGFFPGDKPVYDSKDIEMDEATAFIRALNDLMPAMARKYPTLDAVGIDGNRFVDPVYKWMTLNRGKYPWKIYALRGQGSRQYRVPKGSTKQQTLIGKPGIGCFKRIGRDKMPEVWYDSHHWHLFMQRMWLLSVGEPRSISLFGSNGAVHRNFAEQICSEKLVDLFMKDGKLTYDWHTSGKNEMSDVSTMVNVLANIDGLSPDGILIPRRKIKRVKYSEKYKDKFKQQEAQNEKD